MYSLVALGALAAQQHWQRLRAQRQRRARLVVLLSLARRCLRSRWVGDVCFGQNWRDEYNGSSGREKGRRGEAVTVETMEVHDQVQVDTVEMARAKDRKWELGVVWF